VRRGRTIGAQLAWMVALATALGMLAFTSVAAFVVWLDERDDGPPKIDRPKRPRPAPKPKGRGDDVLDEILEDLGAAVLVATPLGLAVAVLAARWSAGRITRRIDDLILSASRITADDLRHRLPLSPADDELDDLAGSLNQVFDRIDEGVATLRRFAADTSHELRTPLAVMINALEVAARRPREVAEWERVSARTLDELRGMADLVEALLQGARAGAFDLAVEPVEIDGEVERVALRWSEAAQAAGVVLEVEASACGATRIDPRGLAIALGNLIGNAIGHSPAGGRVRIRALAADDRVRIEVDDDGPGVPAEDRERIFAPFARGEAPAPPRAGSGLGLSIARRIVLAHGGTIAVEDAPSGGARFAVELPAADPS
jgi:signal transduction histidine kinase